MRRTHRFYYSNGFLKRWHSPRYIGFDHTDHSRVPLIAYAVLHVSLVSEFDLGQRNESCVSHRVQGAPKGSMFCPGQEANPTELEGAAVEFSLQDGCFVSLEKCTLQAVRGALTRCFTRNAVSLWFIHVACVPLAQPPVCPALSKNSFSCYHFHHCRWRKSLDQRQPNNRNLR